jgi:uncharacterized cupredoxin-like copper-binding protein
LTPGEVTFDITNSGPSVHEFVVMKSDLPDDQIPVDGEEANEDAPGLRAVDEKENIAAGSQVSLGVTLEPGHYVVICNIAGHYSAGMHASFTVTG